MKLKNEKQRERMKKKLKKIEIKKHSMKTQLTKHFVHPFIACGMKSKWENPSPTKQEKKKNAVKFVFGVYIKNGNLSEKVNFPE